MNDGEQLPRTAFGHKRSALAIALCNRQSARADQLFTQEDWTNLAVHLHNENPSFA